jgi:hypothetical protein
MENCVSVLAIKKDNIMEKIFCNVCRFLDNHLTINEQKYKCAKEHIHIYKPTFLSNSLIIDDSKSSFCYIKNKNNDCKDFEFCSDGDCGE